MKKRLLLIVCCVLVLVFCASALLACKGNDTLDEATLEALLQLAKSSHDETGNVTSNFTVSGTVSTFDEEKDEMVKANIQWTPSVNSVTTTEADGIVTVVLPTTRDEDLTFTLKATLVDAKGKAYKRADGTEYTFTITRTARATNASIIAANSFYDKIVKDPQVDVAYKAVVFKEYTAWYFAGTTESTNTTYRYNTTFKYDESPDVKLEATEGGYYLYFMNGSTKTYIDIFRYSGNASTGFVTDKTQLKGVYTIHETGALLGIVSDGGTEYRYYLGMRGQYLPSISAITNPTPLNDGVNATGYKYTDNPVFLVSEDVSYQQETLTEAEVLAKAKALDDNEELAGRYSLTGVVTKVVPNGTYTDIDVYMNLSIEDLEVMCYRLTKGSSLHEGDTIKVTGVLKNYKKDADTDAIIEFIANAHYELIKKAPVDVPSNVDKVTTPAADTDYKLAIDSEDKVLQYYLLNKMDATQTNFVATTTSVLSGVNFRVEAADGGYKIYWLDGTTKKYVGAKLNGSYTNLVLDVADAQLVWKIDENGIHTTLGEKEVYIALKGSYTTVGLYTEGDDIWKAYLGTIKPEASKVEIKLDKEYENADVVINPTTANIGDEVTVTVTAKNGYTIGELKVNGVAITAEEEGVYKFTVKDNTVISLMLLDPSGEAPKGTATNPYTVEEARVEAAKLGGGVYSAEQVYVKGIIVTTISVSSNRLTFNLADNADDGTDKQLVIYNLVLQDEAVTAIYKGDSVVLYGYLQNYVKDETSTLEMTSQKMADDSYVNPTAKEIIARGDASIKAAETWDENVTLTFITTADTNNVVTGHNHDLVEFTLECNDDYGIQEVKVNGTVVTPNGEGVYSVRLDGTMTITVEVYEKSETPSGPQTINGDLVTKFSTYASDWGTGYSEHIINASDIGINIPGIGVTATLSRGNKQTGTITTMPVMGANGEAQTFKVSVTGAKIQSASFTLKEWGTGKKFTKVIIEYTTDGETWTKADGYEGSAAPISGMDFTDLTVTSGELPANVTAVRLNVVASTSSNTQLGIQAFSLVVE